MRLEFTDAHLAIQDQIRKFAASGEVQKIIKKAEEDHKFSYEFAAMLRDLNYFGLSTPEEYGGAGIDTVSAVIIVEEMGYQWAAGALFLAVQSSLTQYPIYKFGTSEQKQKYLPLMASGEKLACFMLTEPDHGSDAINLELSCDEKSDHWLINGTKQFITNASVASVGILFARHDKKIEGKDGITAFIIDMEKNSPHFSFREERKMGLHGLPLCEVSIRDLRVPKENLLGAKGGGWLVADTTLTYSRIFIAAKAQGVSRRAFDVAREYAANRRQFKMLIKDIKETASRLFRMEKRVKRGHGKLYTAAFKEIKSADYKDYRLEASRAKLATSEFAFANASDCQIVHGGMGFIEDTGVPRMLRDSSVMRIYEGTSDIQCKIIQSERRKRKEAAK